ncbi:SusD/RagB family nutrient-binding outer membrane lipoprotein [Sphingobacterium spiritivorum]|uniref:SusD/RagB family nutrient-binding outer membrane lipoprotein n=1 Tax=Sphingobacterium spiritivorum TaxID=258 RepID=UPI003DA20CD4
MKKNIIYIICACVGMSLFFQSCDKNFQEINTDPNKSLEAYPYQFMAPALVNSVSYNMNRNRGFNNELMQVTVNVGDSEGKVFRYDFRRNWADYMWNNLYPVLNSWREMYKKADGGINDNASYRAISLINQSWIFSILTDTYGDLPYTQALLGKDSLIIEPKFDTQKDIYTAIFAKLDTANAWLKANKSINASQDPVFQGNVSRWRKLGNSLYLRLLLRVSGKPEVSALVQAKIKEILETNASNYPIMTSNDDSAILRWTGVAPYTSPFATVREADFRQPGIASFFIDNLVNWNDPRINTSLGTNGVNRWSIAPYQGGFVGVPSGYAPGEGFDRKAYFYSTNQKVGDYNATTLMTDPMTGMIMNYAEVEFIKAEVALKGWTSKNAGELFKSGVKNSITLWLPTWSVPIDEYLDAADFNWSESESFEAKMQKIHLQKYYSLFLVDMQQWFEYRRTGYPVLPKGKGLQNNGEMPSRMTYPVAIQSTNPTNYKLAIGIQGPDEINTKVWWQKP